MGIAIKENPEKFPLPTAPSAKSATKEVEEEKTLLDGKHSRAVIGFMLALAVVNEDDMTVKIPDLSRDFVECFQWDTMELICRTYKSCMQDFMNDRQEHTRDFFIEGLTVLSGAAQPWLFILKVSGMITG